MSQNIPNVADYKAHSNFALNYCSSVINIEVKHLFEENLWAEVSIQVINNQATIIKDLKAPIHLIVSILKHSGALNYQKGKKPLKNSINKCYFPYRHKMIYL